MKFFLTLFAFVLMVDVPAQKLLKGVVLDAEKNTPVPKASVFLNNTSVGTTADDAGKFTLLVPAGRYELIVSSVGFTTSNQNITATDMQDFLTIKLYPKAPELEAVVIEPYLKDGWEQWGRFFLETFIGTTPQAADCKILNRDVIRFRYSKKEGRLTAHASAPLRIENKALGYRIRYELESFVYDAHTQYILYTGYPFFEQLPANKRRLANWEKKRSEIFYGSMMHFMRSVYRNTIQQEGFDVRRLVKLPNQEKKRIQALYERRVQTRTNNRIIFNSINQGGEDSTDYYETVLRQPDYKDVIGKDLLPGDSIAFAVDSVTAGLHFSDYLWVLYKNGKVPRQYTRLFPRNAQAILSHIFLPNNNGIVIQANGMYYNPVDMISSGYWAWSEKIATMLPYDYQPTE